MWRIATGVVTVGVLLGASTCGGAQQEPQSDRGKAMEMKHENAAFGHEHHGESGEMPHSFEDAKMWAKHFEGPERDSWQRPEHVVERMEIQPGMVVADIGAGTGYFLPHLSSAVGPTGKVLALDIEENLVEYMRSRVEKEGYKNAFPKRVAPDDPGLPRQSVDRVLIVNTWHHISERSAYAAKLLEALKPGGAVYVVDFEQNSEKGPPKEFKLQPQQIAEELRKGGMEVDMISEELAEQYIVRGR